MSVEHYWPTEPGKHLVEHKDGSCYELTLWSDGLWDGETFINYPTKELAENRGYLGVRREQPAKPDLNALLREAIAEFRRDVKQPTKAADWAFEWVGRFIEAVEK